MTAEIDFVPVADSGTANAVSQAAWLAFLAGAGANGFQSGLAASNLINKAFRQSTVMAAAVATAVSALLGGANVLDGNNATATLAGQIQQAIASGAMQIVPNTGTSTTAYTGTLPAGPVLVGNPPTGTTIVFSPEGYANSGTTPTLNLGGGAVTIVRNDGSALGIGDLTNTGEYILQFDTYWICLTPLASQIAGQVPVASGTQIHTGASNAVFITPGGLYSALSFSAGNTPGPYSITNGGALTIAHSLPRTPVVVWAILQCTTADNGFSIGDELPIFCNNMNPVWYGGSGPTTNNYGIGCNPDGTNLNIRFGSQGIGAYTKSSGGLAILTSANWEVLKFFCLA